LSLNPLVFEDTRLKKYGELYEKFCFRKFVLHYTSADPSTATGQYIVAYDRDFADSTPSASDIGIREYFAMKGSVISNVYLSTSFRCPLEDPQDFYYTNDTGYEGRLVYQGQLYMAAVSGTTFHGSLWIEYEIELYDPAIESPTEFFEGTKTGGISFVCPTDVTPYGVDMLGDVENIINPDGYRFIHKACGVGWGRAINSGSKGLVVPPGNWYFEYRLATKTDSTGEGWVASPWNPTHGEDVETSYLVSLFAWDRYAKNTTAPDINDLSLISVDSDTPENNVTFTNLEDSGNAIGDSNSSKCIRFIMSVPMAVGYVWLFLSGALTANHPVTIQYNEAIVTIVNLALTKNALEKYSKRKNNPRVARLKSFDQDFSRDDVKTFSLVEGSKEQLIKEIKEAESPSLSKSVGTKNVVSGMLKK